MFSLRDLWADIDALDDRVSASLQAAMHDETSGLVEQAANWFMGHGSQPLDIARSIEDYAAGVGRIAAGLEAMLADSDRLDFDGRTASLAGRGAPEPLARRVAQLRLLVSACDIVRISREVQTDVLRAGPVYFAVGDRFEISWLRREAAALPVDSRWDSQAMSAIVDDLYECQYLLTRKWMSQAGPSADAADILARGSASHRAAHAATSQLIKDIRQGGTLSLAMLAVVNRQLRALVTD